MKEELPLGVVAATRQLEFVHASGHIESVLVSISVPVSEGEPDFWLCPHTIKSETMDYSHSAAGIDPVQALDLALGGVSAALTYLSRRHNGTFQFLGEAGHGFR